MRIESRRKLVLPIPPQKAEEYLAVFALPSLVPEVEEVLSLGNGQLMLFSRLGRRRRAWRARIVESRPDRLELTSASPGVAFRFTAALAPHPEGAELAVEFDLVPPASWRALRPASRAPLFRRLVISTALFALTVVGLLLVPGLRLSGPLAALAYALIGVFFVAAASTLSGTHRPLHAFGRGARAAILP